MPQLSIQNKILEILDYYKKQHPKLNLPGSLFSGKIGVFLFRLAAQRHFNQPDPNFEKELVTFVENQISKPIGLTNFCHGLSGFAWFLHYLNTEEFTDIDQSLFEQLDEVIFNVRQEQFKELNHDFLHGALGDMWYFAERAKFSKKCQTYLIEYVNFLSETATNHLKGIFWYESPIMKDELGQNNQVVNLHISHGQASKIAVLAKALSCGVATAKKPLLFAITYLLSTQESVFEKASIPHVIVNNKKEMFTHLGWCRGNLAISIVLFNAGEVLNDLKLKQKALEIALQTLALNTPQKAVIKELGFCHGTTGLAYMYNRLFEITENSSFKNAADYWFSITLQLATFKNGVAGFKSYNSHSGKWEIEHGLLEGASGAGLAMLSHLSDNKATWDACFLLR